MVLKTCALLLATATAVLGQSALVTVEASHGGAGSDLTNTSLTVPLGTLYTNSALNEVSSLYLTGAEDIDTSRITCTPYRYSNGTGTAGSSFTQNSPSILSTNTVPVGSLLCTASALGGGTSSSTSLSSSTGTSSTSSSASISSSSSTSSSTTSSSSSSTSSITTSSSSSTSSTSSSSSTSTSRSSTPTSSTSLPPRTSTSIFITTITPTSDSQGGGGVITVTSTATPTPATSTTTTSRPSSTTSSPPTLVTPGAAVKNSIGKWIVAVGGVGLVAWL